MLDGQLHVVQLLVGLGRLELPLQLRGVHVLHVLVEGLGRLLVLLGVLGPKGLLVLNLGGDGADLLLLALDTLSQLGVDALQVGNNLLGQLQVSHNLALGLLHVILGFLLTLQSILALIQGLLQLALDLVEVVAPVLHGLDVLLSLLPALASRLLLYSGLKVLDLIPEPAGIASHLAAGLLDLVDLVILSLDAEVGGINLLPQIVLGALKTGGLVNDILDSGASGVEGEHQLVLL